MGTKKINILKKGVNMKYLMPLIVMCCIGCATTTTGYNELYEEIKTPIHPAKHGMCVKGERFKADCNWCTCYKDGPKQKALCTKMLCRGFRKK
jgi:hypothetical protein